MTDKEKIRAEIERQIPLHICGYQNALQDMLKFIDSLPEEPVSKELEEAATASGQRHFPDAYNIWARPNYEARHAELAFKEGAHWQKRNLWHNAQGDVLPEIDREVVVFTQNFPDDAGIMRIAIAHRPNTNGWDGKSLSTGEVEHYTPMTYGKGGWNMEGVTYWLDVELPEGIE